MKNKITRRDSIKLAGISAAQMALFSLSGCENSADMSPRIVTPVRKRVASDTEIYKPDVMIPQKSASRSPWQPLSSLENKSRWHGIVIHHTATDMGPAALLDKSARAKGWDGLGYDFVINNGNGAADGKIEVGFRWHQQIHGAHCRPEGCDDNYWNEHTVGIALVGNFEYARPTWSQYNSLARVVAFLKKRYRIPESRIYGHKQVPGASTKCPGRNFSWYSFNNMLARQMDISDNQVS